MSQLAFLSAVALFGAAVADIPKVHVKVYMESQCPHTAKFLATQFAPAWPVFKDYMDAELVVYGKATYNMTKFPNGSFSIDFTCQNGALECSINYFDVCGMAALGNDPLRYVPFVLCCQRKTLEQVKVCADNASLPYDVIKACAEGPSGKALEYKQMLETQRLKPKLAYVPTITINGQVSQFAIFNFKAEFCAAFPNEKPKGC